MSVALIGGMDRLKRHYIWEAERLGIDLRVFNRPEAMMHPRIKGVDAVVVFTNKVSHRAKKEAVRIAKGNRIPILMSHSCGICALRDCLNCLKDGMRCRRWS